MNIVYNESITALTVDWLSKLIYYAVFNSSSGDSKIWVSRLDGSFPLRLYKLDGTTITGMVVNPFLGSVATFFSIVVCYI